MSAGLRNEIWCLEKRAWMGLPVLDCEIRQVQNHLLPSSASECEPHLKWIEMNSWRNQYLWNGPFLYCEYGAIRGVHRPWLSQIGDIKTSFWSLSEELRWKPSLLGCWKDQHGGASGKIPKVLKIWITKHGCLYVVNFSSWKRVFGGRKIDQLSHLTSKAQPVSWGHTKPILWAVSESVLFPSQLG